MTTADYEKMAAFYLGRGYDVDRSEVTDDVLLYDAKDLTTHAVCVGMTGSGKTGLCISLLEEAAIDGIPAIAIDPKGDLGNLLLNFPQLRPEDFRPWVDDGEATRKGLSPDEYARKTAATWSKGLASWGQDGARIQRLRDAVDMAIYTPGSSAGIPLTVLRSFNAPPPELIEDGDALRERVLAAVSGLLALLGVDADPVRSREHILLSNILDRAWREERDLDIAALIQEIQQPPFERVGVMNLESFFPGKERFELAMTLNNLLASPGFAAWMEGETLDIQRLLWTPEGKPRLTIISIAHLGEAERMFFVTILLNEVLAWVRTQPGTSSLRALLYMDEVFGFFPPSRNPPSKTPMLTLLKQARAYGLGIMLATQNPVDLDYKGLSNTGTWFLGRLQTERDKMRVLDGLEGAASTTGTGFDRARTEAILSGLKSRVFMLNNVHDDGPMVFHTRWAMSYLRGPLTRTQIRTLTAGRKAAAPSAATSEKLPRKEKRPKPRPVLPPEVPEVFLLRSGRIPEEGKLLYRPALLGHARLHYSHSPRDIDLWEEVALLARLPSGKVPVDPWAKARMLGSEVPDTEDDPEEGAGFAPPPAEAAKARSYKTWEKVLKSYLYRERPLSLWRCKAYKAASRPGEIEGDFRARVGHMAREKRDLAIEKLRARYTPKLATIQTRIRKAEERVERETEQHKHSKLQSAVSIGATILGALFGRKVASAGTIGRAGTAAGRMSRTSKEKADIGRAKAEVKEQQQRLADLDAEFRTKLEALQAKGDPSDLVIEDAPLRPRKSDIAIGQLSLAWTPWGVGAEGDAEPLYRSAEDGTR